MNPREQTTWAPFVVHHRQVIRTLYGFGLALFCSQRRCVRLVCVNCYCESSLCLVLADRACQGCKAGERVILSMACEVSRLFPCRHHGTLF